MPAFSLGDERVQPSRRRKMKKRPSRTPARAGAADQAIGACEIGKRLVWSPNSAGDASVVLFAYIARMRGQTASNEPAPIEAFRRCGSLSKFLKWIPCLMTIGLSVSSAWSAETYDIVVYGGNSGGVMAAVQAARMGKTIALIEPGKHLGGMTSGGLGFVDVGDPKTIGGLGREYFHKVWSALPGRRQLDVGEETQMPGSTRRCLTTIKPCGLSSLP